jgi:hypothetical protein
VCLDHGVLRILDDVEQDFLQVMVVRPYVGHRLEVGPDGDSFRIEARFLERSANRMRSRTMDAARLAAASMTPSASSTWVLMGACPIRWS